MRTSWLHQNRPQDLTPRELSSLDCVSRGLSAVEGAAMLGISRSTFAKHLANARTKLDVARTVEAVAICIRRGVIGPVLPVERPAPWTQPDEIRAAEDLICDLEACVSIHQAWEVMNRHGARIGASAINFAVIAEPKGHYTNGGRMISISLPSEIAQLYDAAGGTTVDPFVPWAAKNEGSMTFDVDRVPSGFQQDFSPAMGRFAMSLPDHGYSIVFGSSLRDAATGASFAMPFFARGHAATEVRRYEARFLGLQRVLSQVFWEFLQDRKLLAELIPLSPRVREALRLAAVGLNASECAERMHISRRAVEELLCRGREAFAAPTTTAAIYRACVYRVLT